MRHKLSLVLDQIADQPLVSLCDIGPFRQLSLSHALARDSCNPIAGGQKLM